MGNGGSSCEQHHYHTVYQTPPAVQKQLEEQSTKLKELEAEAIKRSNPKLYQTNSTNLLNEFVKNIPKLELTDFIKKETGDNHIGFVGPISAGKTSMINVLFNKNLPIALGHCTDKCEVVHVQGKNKIWDVSGQNDDFKFYRAENLAFIKDLDKIVILTDADIQMIANILKVIHAINPNNMIIVRTKVDQHTQSNLRSITEEQQLDMQKVKDLLGVEIKTYCVSSHNVTNGKNKYDWDLVMERLGLV